MTTLTEVFPYFSLSCKVNARVKPAKTGPALFLVFVLLYDFFVLFYVFLCSLYCRFCDVSGIVYVYMCTEQLPPSVYPIAVKYIPYHISHTTFLVFVLGIEICPIYLHIL
jgi:hypothetical protein